MVQRIAENIFEALPADEARAFFAALPEAVACDGKDLSKVGWRFLAAELRSLPPQPPETQAVVDPVIAGLDLLAEGQNWPESAAAAGEAAAWAAEAAEAAWATAWMVAAGAAVEDREAAGLAARRRLRDLRLQLIRRQRDLLLQLISSAPMGGL
jgi:hypothetical protein